MRIRLSLIAVASLIIAALFVVGCGGTTKPAPPTVSLSILAPTSGATIGVRNIVVAGTVSPASAIVTVGGQTAQVVDGVYHFPLQMAQPNETITVTGQADGYAGASQTTTVQYSAAMAAAIAASESALGQQQPSKSSSNHSAKKGAHKSGRPAAKPGYHPAGAATSPSSSSHPSSSSQHQASHSSSSSHHSSSRHHSSSKSNSSGGSGGSSRSGRTPEPRTVLTTKDIKHLWINGCVKPGTGGTYTSYCRCTYKHLEKAGALKSRKRLESLIRKLRPYERTHNLAKLPAFVRRALVDCVGKLPPLYPLVGKPVIRKLPGMTHPSQPPSGSGNNGSPAGSGTPGAPTSTPTTPTGTPTTPTGTPVPTGQSSNPEPPWALLVRKLDHVVAALATRHPASARQPITVPSASRTARLSKPRRSPERRHHRAS